MFRKSQLESIRNRGLYTKCMEEGGYDANYHDDDRYNDSDDTEEDLGKAHPHAPCPHK